MKSLTSIATTQCQSRYNEPVLLLEIDWAAGDTGRYAERDISVEGVAYSGIIRQVGPISSCFAPPGSEYAPVGVTIFADDEFRDKTSAAPIEGRSARIRLHFEGTTDADTIELFTGLLDGLLLTGPDAAEMKLVGLFSKYDRLLPGDIVSPDDFPKAEEQDIGRPMPIVFGNVPDLPTLKVKTGARTNLNGSILSSDTTIETDDASRFPNSGTLLIEEEQVTYTGISADVFTGCTRGAGGTQAVDHLNRSEVIEYMTEHIYLAAGHACKAVDNIRVSGVPIEAGQCAVNLNNTGLVSGKSLATLSFVNRPKVRRYSQASRFLEMQFDATATGNEATNPSYCYDTTLDGFATLVSKISGAAGNDTLRIKQITDVSAYGEKYGEILKAFLMVEHFESKTLVDDYLSAYIAGQSHTLAKPSEEDTTGGGGDVDIDHGHNHSITGEHTHTMTVKKEPVFTDNITQTGGTKGLWLELDDIAGGNLNRSGFTSQADTDRSLLCRIATTTSKGSVQKIQFCCRRGESGMSGSFYFRFYRNGSLEKTYTISAVSAPTTWKSGWEIISGLNWSDLEASDTYVLITPVAGNTENIRLFGAWYEFEYLEQPANYEGSGVKADGDVQVYNGTNVTVINEDPISSTSVVEGIDITDLVGKDWSWFNNREAWVDYNITGSNDGVTGYILHVWFEIEFAPYEEIISDDVTCGVQGVETNGDGTGDLIENPADVIQRILTSFIGLDQSTYIDSASFAAARQSLQSAGAKFAFALREKMSASRLVDLLAEQARSRFKFDGGKYRLIYRDDTLGQPVREMLPSGLALDSSRLQRPGLAKMFNELIGYHSRDYGKGGGLEDRYSSIAVSENSASQSQYGLKGKEIELFALRDASYAGALTDFLVARNAQPPRRYTWRSLLRDADLERGDIVKIGSLDMDIVKVGAEIVSASFVSVGESGRDLDMLSFEAELEAFDYYWSSSGGSYIRLVDNAFYFVVKRELVARLTADGILYIKGFVVGDQTLPAAPGNPISYDQTCEAIAFALSDNTRVMELDDAGNILLPIQEETDQGPLTFAGEADEINSDASTVWFNIGSTRAAEVNSAGLLLLPKYIVENCNWEMLYG